MKRKLIARVYQNKKKEWQWKIIATNGEIIAWSGKGYKKEDIMLKALYELMGNSYQVEKE